MIIGRAQLRNPEETVLRLSVEMRLVEWERLLKQIGSTPSKLESEVYTVCRLIESMVSRARQEIYVNENDLDGRND